MVATVWRWPDGSLRLGEGRRKKILNGYHVGRNENPKASLAGLYLFKKWLWLWLFCQNSFF